MTCIQEIVTPTKEKSKGSLQDDGKRESQCGGQPVEVGPSQKAPKEIDEKDEIDSYFE